MLYLNDGSTISPDQYPEDKSLILMIKYANLANLKPCYLDSFSNYWELCNEIYNNNLYGAELVEYCTAAVAELETCTEEYRNHTFELVVSLLEALVEDARILTGVESPSFTEILHSMTIAIIKLSVKGCSDEM